MISLILATDMRHHFEAVSLFRIRRHAPDFDLLRKSEDAWYAALFTLRFVGTNAANTFLLTHRIPLVILLGKSLT